MKYLAHLGPSHQGQPEGLRDSSRWSQTTGSRGNDFMHPGGVQELHGPKRPRYSLAEMNALTISAFTKLPLN